MSDERDPNREPRWLDPLLGHTVRGSFQACVEIDRIVEDCNIVLLETSGGVLQIHGDVHVEERVIGARFVPDVHSPSSIVDYEPYVWRTRMTDFVAEPFEVRAIHYVQRRFPDGEYLDVWALLADPEKRLRLAVVVSYDELYLERPEHVWPWMGGMISLSHGMRVVCREAT